MSKTATATKKGSTLASKKLDREKVLEAIFEAPAAMRPKLKRMLNAQIKDRQASDEWIKENPEARPITNAQKIEMANLHDQHGVSFRALEGIYHLVANSGMGAYRCVLEGRALQKEKSKANGATKRKKQAAVA
jgi:hypothetical protein